MDNRYDDDDDDDFNPAAMPPCMPSPDIILRLVDTWFSGGQPIRTFIFWVVKVLLTLHSLMGVVLICSAVGGAIQDYSPCPNRSNEAALHARASFA